MFRADILHQRLLPSHFPLPSRLHDSSKHYDINRKTALVGTLFYPHKGKKWVKNLHFAPLRLYLCTTKAVATAVSGRMTLSLSINTTTEKHMTTIIMRQMASGMRSSGGQLFPDFLIRRRIDLAAIAEEISKRCTLTIHDVKACVSALCEVVGEHIGRGHSVQLGELGTFAAGVSLSKRVAAEVPQGQARQVSAFEVRRVHFTPARQLLQVTNNQLQRSAKRQRGVVVASTQQQPAAERLARLERYLKRTGRISVRGYALLVGLSRSSAHRELQHWHSQAHTHVGKRDGRIVWRE